MQLPHAIVGGGLRGLAQARALRKDLTAEAVLLIEQDARPGGSARTQRSEGFVCELGRFAFTADEFAALATSLAAPPPLQSALPTAATGWLWRAGARGSTPVRDTLVAPRGGCEGLAQAFRRELGPSLHLGRRATAIAIDDHGFTLTLGGVLTDAVHAESLTLAVPVAEAAHLLAPFDPRLANAATFLRSEPRAVVHLGFWQSELDAPLVGYGVLADDDPVGLEAIFCTNVFTARAQPGKALVRVEVGGDVLQQDEDAVAAAAMDCLATWVGLATPPVLRRVHRFPVEQRDGAWTECRMRLMDAAARVPGLRIV